MTILLLFRPSAKLIMQSEFQIERPAATHKWGIKLKFDQPGGGTYNARRRYVQRHDAASLTSRWLSMPPTNVTPRARLVLRTE
jgi:hypothetical protein